MIFRAIYFGVCGIAFLLDYHPVAGAAGALAGIGAGYIMRDQIGVMVARAMNKPEPKSKKRKGVKK